jgi:hypothetical protein
MIAMTNSAFVPAYVVACPGAFARVLARAYAGLSSTFTPTSSWLLSGVRKVITVGGVVGCKEAFWKYGASPCGMCCDTREYCTPSGNTDGWEVVCQYLRLPIELASPPPCDSFALAGVSSSSIMIPPTLSAVLESQ